MASAVASLLRCILGAAFASQGPKLSFGQFCGRISNTLAAWMKSVRRYRLPYSNETKTFTAGLTGLIMGDTFIWGQLMASSVIAIIPILVIYIGAQRYIVEGLAAGSVKG